MNEKEVSISKVVEAILESSNSDELCERFYAAYQERKIDDFYEDDDFGVNMLRAIKENSVNEAFYTFCGASAKEILQKGLFISDDRRRFYDEYEEEEVNIRFDDNTQKTVECMLNTDTHEFFDFEIDEEDKDKEISEITVNFCGKDFEVYPKSEMYDDDKWSFWYDDEKWSDK